jgi:phage terminase small subunit
MTPKQARFVAEYAVDMNGTQAAIRAGYSKTRAHVTASELLDDPEIAAAVAVNNRKVVEAVIGSAEWIVERAAEVVNRALNAVPVKDAKGKIIDGEWTCNLSAATPALALLAKRHPEFRDNAPVVDQSQHLHLPEGMGVEEIRAMLGQAKQIEGGA